MWAQARFPVKVRQYWTTVPLPVNKHKVHEVYTDASKNWHIYSAFPWLPLSTARRCSTATSIPRLLSKMCVIICASMALQFLTCTPSMLCMYILWHSLCACTSVSPNDKRCTQAHSPQDSICSCLMLSNAPRRLTAQVLMYSSDSQPILAL